MCSQQLFVLQLSLSRRTIGCCRVAAPHLGETDVSIKRRHPDSQSRVSWLHLAAPNFDRICL